jgi:hypothetical protein
MCFILVVSASGKHSLAAYDCSVEKERPTSYLP